jgi:hypothetical protein
MNGHGQPDRSVVPANPPDKAMAAEAGEERERTKGNTAGETRPGRSAGVSVSSGLDRVRQVAVQDTGSAPVPTSRISENDISFPGYPVTPRSPATIRADGTGRYRYLMVCPGRRGQNGRLWPRTSSRPSRPASGRSSRAEVSVSRPVPLVAPINPGPHMPWHGYASVALAVPHAATTRTN